MINYLIAGLFGLFFSSFFSGSETGFMTIDNFLIKLRSNKSNYYKNIYNFIKNPEIVIFVALIGNNIANVATTQFFEKYLNYYTKYSSLIMTIIFPFVFLLIAEIMPKIIFQKKPYSLIKIAFPLFKLFYIIFYPLILIVKLIVRVLDFSKKKEKGMFFSKEHINHFVKKGLINKLSEKEIYVKEILKLNSMRAGDIYSPVTFFPAINESFKKEEVLPIIEEKKNRIVLIQDEDGIYKGYINCSEAIEKILFDKDVIIHFFEIFSESTKIFDLVDYFKKTTKNLVCIVDEYGDIFGIITRERIFEILIGYFLRKEEDDLYYLERLGKNKYITKGYTNIELINRYLKLNLEKDRYNTIAGYLMNKTGKILKEGSDLEEENIKFTVLSASPNKIDKIKIEIKDNYEN